MAHRRRSALAALAFCAMLLGAGLVTLATPATAAPSVTLAVLGETHGTRTITKQLVAVAESKGATGCVCPGDFIYGDSAATPAGWRDMMQPFMGQLLPAQGNHDWPWTDWKGMFPGERPYYSQVIDGVRFISVNPEHNSLAPGSTQREWLETTLSAEPDSAMKVVFLHRPWWLPDGARHPASEFEARARTSAESMESLMREHGVDLVVSAHEKNYQHSYRDGIHYVVAGGTGPEYDKYAMGYTLPGAVKRLSTPVGSVLHVSSTSLVFESFDQNGRFVESFEIRPTTGAFSPSFTPHGGNTAWVQTRLGEPAARVDARIDGGAWQPLSFRSWGSWAAGIPAPDGSIVEFRATRVDGAQATSGKFLWPSGAPVGLKATFTPHDGNAWWVQTKVAGSEPLAKVEARVDGGTWKPLTLRSWGSWAAGLSAPDGSKVEFRATGVSGGQATSMPYVWPTGSAPATAATFTPHEGNEWWVQTKVDASSTVRSVEARVDGGAWKALTLRSWGSWAAGIHAPSGSRVEFRATLGSGDVVTSGAYAWPAR